MFRRLINLYSQRGVVATIFPQGSYGTPWTKSTCFVHSVVTLPALADVAPPPVPTVVLRGMCEWEGVQVFRTSLAQSYAPDLGVRYGELTEQAWRLVEMVELCGTQVAVLIMSLNQIVNSAWWCH